MTTSSASPAAKRKPQKKKAPAKIIINIPASTASAAPNLRWSPALLPDETPKPNDVEASYYKKRKKTKRTTKEKEAEHQLELPVVESQLKPTLEAGEDCTETGNSKLLATAPFLDTIPPPETPTSAPKHSSNPQHSTRPPVALPLQPPPAMLNPRSEPFVLIHHPRNQPPPPPPPTPAEQKHSPSIAPKKTTFSSLNPHGSDLHGDAGLRRTIMPPHRVGSGTEESPRSRYVKHNAVVDRVGYEENLHYPTSSKKVKARRLSEDAQDYVFVPRFTKSGNEVLSESSTSLAAPSSSDMLLTAVPSLDAFSQEAVPSDDTLAPAAPKNKRNRKRKPKRPSFSDNSVEPESFESKPAFTIDDLTPQQEYVPSGSPKTSPTVRFPSPQSDILDHKDPAYENFLNYEKYLQSQKDEKAEQTQANISVLPSVLKISDLVEFGKRKKGRTEMPHSVKGESDQAKVEPVKVTEPVKDQSPVAPVKSAIKPTSTIKVTAVAPALKTPPGLPMPVPAPPGFDGSSEASSRRLPPGLYPNAAPFMSAELAAQQEAIAFQHHGPALAQGQHMGVLPFPPHQQDFTPMSYPPQQVTPYFYQQYQTASGPYMQMGQAPNYGGYPGPQPSPQFAYAQTPYIPPPPQSAIMPTMDGNGNTIPPFGQYGQYPSPYPNPNPAVGSWPPPPSNIMPTPDGQGPHLQIHLLPPEHRVDSPISPLVLNASPVKTYAFPLSPGPIPPRASHLQPGHPQQQTQQAQPLPPRSGPFTIGPNPQAVSFSPAVVSQSQGMHGQYPTPQQAAVVPHQQMMTNERPPGRGAFMVNGTPFLDQTGPGHGGHYAAPRSEHKKLFNWKEGNSIEEMAKHEKSPKNKHLNPVKPSHNSNRGGGYNSSRGGHSPYQNSPLAQSSGYPTHVNERYYPGNTSQLHVTSTPLHVPSSIPPRPVSPQTGKTNAANAIITDLHARHSIPDLKTRLNTRDFPFPKPISTRELERLLDLPAPILLESLNRKLSAYIYSSPFRMLKIFAGTTPHFEILPGGWRATFLADTQNFTRRMREDVALWATVRNWISVEGGGERVCGDELVAALEEIGVRAETVDDGELGRGRKEKREEGEGGKRSKSCGDSEEEFEEFKM
ncbi:hypothetical protein BJ508DRAFT_313171 [Ascobolus immersus RN42]|uniref:Uncharacterized protein n=1 Tax=Ascobolus immersus RN42 TaxID=1160509 RepID=A0A3N4HNS8_ASCIM|nr:hypothetical protein BJ508DRAFT_313171 [Ascobolus immersus RN42]